jgi:hypothetical protein
MKNLFIKNHFVTLLVLCTVLMTLPGCEIIGGIFKAGVWVGVILVVLVVAVIFWIMSKIGGK